MSDTAFNLKTAEICAAVRISRRTLFHWLKFPKPPPHVRIGHKYFFNLDLFQGWMSYWRRG